MSKHTPGPWEVSRLPPKTPDDCTTGYEREWVYISGQDHIGLATAVWRLDGERSETCEANAHLIAAAPELLEALVDFIKLFGADDDPMLIELLNKAREVIAKAKGEE